MTRDEFIEKWAEKFLCGWCGEKRAKDVKYNEEERIPELLKEYDEMNEKSVTEKDVFDFHNNLMTIQNDMNREGEDSSERERAYIKYWLEFIGVKCSG